jgi:hypothetical protein
MPIIYTEKLNKDNGGGRQLFPEQTINLNCSPLDTVEIAFSVAFSGLKYGANKGQSLALDIISDQPDVSGKKTIGTLSCPAVDNQQYVFQCIGTFKKQLGTIKISTVFNTTDCTISGSGDSIGYFTISYL